MHRQRCMPRASMSRTSCPKGCVTRNTAMSWKKVQHSSRRILSWCLGDFWEKVGGLVNSGLLEPNLYLEMGAYRAIEAWDQLTDVIELRRRKEPLQWAAFDHIVKLSQEYLERRGGLPQVAINDQ